MFSNTRDFNGDVSGWDVSNVSTMSWLFYNASSFNGSLRNWNVSGVTEMSGLFSRASAFSSDISTWCVAGIQSEPPAFSVPACPLPASRKPRWGAPDCGVGITAPPIGISVCNQALPLYAIDPICVNGVWNFTVPSCVFFGSCPAGTPVAASPPSSGTSGPIVIAPGTRINLSGNTTVSNVTLLIPIGPSTGQLVVQDCLTITGSIIISLPNSSIPQAGDSVPVIVSNRPECFFATFEANVTVQNVAQSSCAKVSAAPQITSTPTSKSLLVLFAVDSSRCNPGSIPSFAATGTVGDSLVGPIVGGVIGGVVLIALVIGGVGFYITRSRMIRARSGVQERLNQSKNGLL